MLKWQFVEDLQKHCARNCVVWSLKQQQGVMTSFKQRLRVMASFQNLPGAVLNMCCVTSFSGIYKSQACTAECVLSGIVTRAVVLIGAQNAAQASTHAVIASTRSSVYSVKSYVLVGILIKLLWFCTDNFPSLFCMFIGYSSGKSIEEFTACTLFLVTCLFLLPACQLLV